MVKLIRILLLFISFQYTTIVSAQADSTCELKVYVLTCNPGTELYSTFGHTALRITNTLTGTDIVFNYGTFDFDDPDFYIKFVRGKLDYFLAAEDINNFLYLYQLDNRSIYQQELNLTCAEKTAITNAMALNMQGNNRFYRYDFLFDNCTSRVRDVLAKHTKSLYVNKPLTPNGTTYRNLLYEYLNKGGKAWQKLGIDILLGSKLDAAVNNSQAMFLPDYLMKGIDSAKREDNTPLLANKTILFQATTPTITNNINHPLVIMLMFAAIIFGLSKSKKVFASITLKIIDAFLLYVTGLLGLLLLFMWFGTDHVVCGYNFNLLWAMPFNFFAAFFVWKKRTWMQHYCRIAAALNAGLLLLWIFIPQELNLALMPIVFTLMYRMYQLSK
jgi:sensor histidine kinase YesM